MRKLLFRLAAVLIVLVLWMPLPVPAAGKENETEEDIFEAGGPAAGEERDPEEEKGPPDQADGPAAVETGNQGKTGTDRSRSPRRSASAGREEEADVFSDDQEPESGTVGEEGPAAEEEDISGGPADPSEEDPSEERPDADGDGREAGDRQAPAVLPAAAAVLLFFAAAGTWYRRRKNNKRDL